MLCISYYWPPAGGPGAQRIVKFAKYLPDFGWQPIVLTVKNGEFPYIDESLANDTETAKVIRTYSIEPFQFYKKMTGRKSSETLPVGLLTVKSQKPTERIAGWMRSNLFVPDARVGWIPFAVRKGLSIIRRENIDAIFTSSPPHSLQLAGLWLKKLTGLPWIVDFRDPWTDIRYYQFSNRLRFAKKLDAYYERQVLQSADHILTVSADLVHKFQQKVRHVSSDRIHVMPNGFDVSDFQHTVSVGSEKFTILHSGNILAHQNPTVLWKALQHYIAEQPTFADQLEIRFIGRVHPAIVQSIHEYGLTNYTNVHGFIPHSEIIREMMAATILLMVVPQTKSNLGIVTGKLFEYIGSGRPILAIGPTNGDAAIILKPFPNSMVCDYYDTESCVSFIKQIYGDFQRGEVLESPTELRAPYSRVELTWKLATILDNAIH